MCAHMPSRVEIPILQIDAFADEPFTGNPAAVCLPDVEPPAGWMQQVAAEMNLSETAFAWPSGDGYGLRWFTPVAEVDLCGHATLDRKSTRLNSSHKPNSYAVFCLKKKTIHH